MTQEDKELLLKDLSGRIPYGVKCKWEHEYDGKTYTGGGVLCDIDHVKTPNGYRYWDCYFEDEGDEIPIELVKPYLRPMSSMTEDEKKELLAVVDSETKDIIDQLKTDNCGIMEGKYHFNSLKELDWLKRHFFDYRGLIEMGLALPATKEWIHK